MKRTCFVLLSVALTLSAWAAGVFSNWQIKEEGYLITFKTKGAKGSFKGLTGQIHFAENELAQSSFDVTVDVNTLDTGIGMKNKHALAEDFFDTAHYPRIHFVSSQVTKSDSGFVVTGSLTIKEVTKEISIPFTFEHTGSLGSFNGQFEINRKDFNLNKKGVGEAVEIKVNVPVVNG